MTEPRDGGKRLHAAIRAALETAFETGRIRGSASRALETTLSRLDEKIGGESTDLNLRVQAAPEQCLVVVHSIDPAANDVVGSFMHHGGATRLGSARGWLLPLGGVPVNRWVLALHRVLMHERRASGNTNDGATLPIRFTVVWARGDDLMVADVG